MTTDWTLDSFGFKKVKDKFEAMKLDRDRVIQDLATARAEKEQAEIRHDYATKARVVIQRVAQKTQQKLEYHISNLVTLAEASVFPDPYEFQVEFVQRRNRTECDLWFVKGEEKMDGLKSVGGGVLDVASFALRCAFWSLKKTRPVIILDEPFRFVSVDLQLKCPEMLKAISQKLGIQVIMVSHLPRIIGHADKVFEVTQNNGISEVEEV